MSLNYIRSKGSFKAFFIDVIKLLAHTVESEYQCAPPTATCALGNRRNIAVLRCIDLTTSEEEPFLILSDHFCFFCEWAFQVLWPSFCWCGGAAEGGVFAFLRFTGRWMLEACGSVSVWGSNCIQIALKMMWMRNYNGNEKWIYLYLISNSANGCIVFVMCQILCQLIS